MKQMVDHDLEAHFLDQLATELKVDNKIKFRIAVTLCAELADDDVTPAQIELIAGTYGLDIDTIMEGALQLRVLRRTVLATLGETKSENHD